MALSQAKKRYKKGVTSHCSEELKDIKTAQPNTPLISIFILGSICFIEDLPVEGWVALTRLAPTYAFKNI
jgi:hypothetical protein